MGFAKRVAFAALVIGAAWRFEPVRKVVFAKVTKPAAT